MSKRFIFLMLATLSSMGHATVLVDIPGAGAPYQGCTPQCTQSIWLLAPYDPALPLFDQIDNAGVRDGDSIVFDHGVVSPVTDSATHISWNGLGTPGLGFIIGVWDASVPPAIPSTGMPGFGSTGGTEIAMLSLPIGTVVTSPSVNGMTHYTATIPPLPLIAGHAYKVSIAAVSGNWQWEASAEMIPYCVTGTGCYSFSRASGAVKRTVGALISDLGFVPMAYQLSNDAVVSAPVPPSITTTALANATSGVAYSAAVNVSYPAGDSATTTVTGLPAGLAFDAASSTITGVPTTIGAFPVTITAADATTGLTTSSALTLTVADAAVTFTPTLPNAITNQAYSATIPPASGGTPPFTYSATNLPAGLALNGTTLAGTVTVAGAYPITLTATDAVGIATNANVTLNVADPVAVPTACSDTAAAITSVGRDFIGVNGGISNPGGQNVWYTPTAAGTTFIAPATGFVTGEIVDYAGTLDTLGSCHATSMTVKPRVAITSTTLPNGTAGVAYTAPINIAWGVAPYTATVLGLPAGLSFDGANIVGTPTVTGTNLPVAVNAVDARGVSAATNLSLTITAPPITGFSVSLPAGTVGTPYSASLSATGGYGAFTYAATGLPAGLSLTGNSIAGTPTTAGTFSVTLTATDTLGQQVSTSSSVVISAPATGPSCTKPAGATGGLNSKGSITAVNGNVVTFKTSKGRIVNVTVPPCATIQWNGGATAFAVGQVFEWNGYYSAATGNVAQKVTIN